MKEIEIPEGYEARIEGNKVIMVPKESEDEMIRKAITKMILDIDGGYPFEKYGVIKKEVLAYLEKQKDEAQRQFNLGIQAGREEAMYEMDKEPQPAEWSEKDRTMLEAICTIIRMGVPVESSAKEKIDWLKSLRPHPHWKPYKEQISALERAIIKMHTPSDIGILAELRDNLKKLQL